LPESLISIRITVFAPEELYATQSESKGANNAQPHISIDKPGYRSIFIAGLCTSTGFLRRTRQT
jgi:hypothetical protein